MPSANQSFTAKALLDKNKESKSPPVFFISISTNEWALSPFTAPQAVVLRVSVSASYFASPSAFYFKVNETNTSEFVFFCLRENQEGVT